MPDWCPRKYSHQAEWNDEDNLGFQNQFKRAIEKETQVEMKMEVKNLITQFKNLGESLTSRMDQVEDKVSNY